MTTSVVDATRAPSERIVISERTTIRLPSLRSGTDRHGAPVDRRCSEWSRHGRNHPDHERYGQAVPGGNRVRLSVARKLSAAISSCARSAKMSWRAEADSVLAFL